MPRMSMGGRFGGGRDATATAAAAPAKRRRFFSAAHLPPLPVALVDAPKPPRAVASDRVLAALQTDERAVVAAKMFVKEKMGDDKWDVVDKTRVTRGRTTATAIANGTPPAKRHAASAVSTPTQTASPTPTPAPTISTTVSIAATPTDTPAATAVATPADTTPAVTAPPTPKITSPPRKVPAAKVQPKRLAIGSAAGSIAQRIKAKGAQVARKVTLRSATAKPAPAPVSAPAALQQPPPPPSQPIAGPSRLWQTTTATDLHAEEEEEEDELESDGETFEPNPGKRKEFLESGLYCQHEDPPEELMLVNRVLAYRQPKKRGRGRGRKSAPDAHLIPIATPPGEPVSFPPLPLEFHYDLLFGGEQHEFQLPYNIMWESESGALDGKKRPPFFQKIRTNQFIERAKVPAYGDRAVCHCDPDYGCGDNCINFIMSYICGSECPCGDRCGNKSLARRKGKATKVTWTGSRGFGLFAAEDIKEGEFVADYRGEIIHINTFIERIGSIYKGKRNFYALAYDRDEVIDAGLRGNDSRFINHGCNPNLEVRKYSTLGDGYDEYEVGMWAKRPIKAGEELFYNYNFDSFAVMVNRDDERQRCMCGAPNCIGFLGRKAGERSAKELAADMARDASSASRKGKGRRASSTVSKRTSTPMSAPPTLAPPEPRLRGRRRGSAVEAEVEPAASVPEPAEQKRQISRLRKSAAELPVVQQVNGTLPKVQPPTETAAASVRAGRPSRAAAVPAADRAREATPPTCANSAPEAAATPAIPVAVATPAVAVAATPATGSSAATSLSTDTTTPTTRKRGRPPKPRPAEEPAKRPRGRPRIHPLPDPNNPNAKRPRGRPRKHPLPGAFAGSDGQSQPMTPESEYSTSYADSASPATPSAASPALPLAPAASSPRVKPEPITPELTTAPLPATTTPRRRVGRPPKVRPAPYSVPARTAAAGSSTANPGSTRKSLGAALNAAAQSVGSSMNSLKIKLVLKNGGAVPAAEPEVAAPQEATTAGTPAPASDADAATPATPRLTRKKQEVAKRNGAPAGWVYLPVGAPPPLPEPEGPPSARAQRLARRGH